MLEEQIIKLTAAVEQLTIAVLKSATAEAKAVFLDNGVPYVNTYKPSFAKPNPDRAQEAGDLFLTHVGHLVKEPEHRVTLVDFLAYHVQKPGEKIRWATLIQGGMGCGKTFSL